MRGFFTGSLSRLAIVALVTTSFAAPLALDASSAFARASAGTAGAAGGTGGGSGGGGTGGGNPANVTGISSLDQVPPPRRFRAEVDKQHDQDSCYQSEQMFDRWGHYVGKRQLPDFCY